MAPEDTSISRSTHRLDPLLRPRSIALVGASPKEGSYGRLRQIALQEGAFPGDLYLVNPGYEEIDGQPCYPDVGALPETPDHAILMVGNARVEAALQSAIDEGVAAATIYGSCYLDEDTPVSLLDRLRDLANRHGVMICGGNGMGYYNRDDRINLQMGKTFPPEAPGNVTFITHSGSVLMAYCHYQDRVNFNLSVSSGHEITTTFADYMDFALELESTRVICLFIETVRDPAGFIDAMEKAAARDVPVVICKVGRSEKAKAFAITHSDALAGDDAVFDAVCERYGAIRVNDLDEMMATVQLLAIDKQIPSRGTLGALLDSGGERELLADAADAFDVPFATVSEATRKRLIPLLDEGLEPENPVDAWGTGHDYENKFRGCMEALMDDDNCAIGLWVADLTDDFPTHEGYARGAAAVAAQTDKPIAFVSCYAHSNHPGIVRKLAASDIPVIDGVRPAMAAVAAVLRHRDSLNRAKPVLEDIPADIVAQWQSRLNKHSALDEDETLDLLSDFGVPVIERRQQETREEVLDAARELGFPLAMKTAKPGLAHKSDVGGVVLGIESEEALLDAYDDLAQRLHPRVLLAKMAPKGTEIAFGLVKDPQFGPIVMISAGGVLIEIVRDAVFAVPPFDTPTARTLIDRLAIRPALDGVRGAEPGDIDALASAFSRFSMIAAHLGSQLEGLDVNPLIVHAEGAVAVDAYLAPTERKEHE